MVDQPGLTSQRDQPQSDQRCEHDGQWDADHGDRLQLHVEGSRQQQHAARGDESVQRHGRGGVVAHGQAGEPGVHVPHRRPDTGRAIGFADQPRGGDPVHGKRHDGERRQLADGKSGDGADDGDAFGGGEPGRAGGGELYGTGDDQCSERHFAIGDGAGDADGADRDDDELHPAGGAGNGGKQLLGDLHGEWGNGALQLDDLGGHAAGWGDAEPIGRGGDDLGRAARQRHFNYTVTVTDSSTPVQSASQAYNGTVSGATAAVLTVSPMGLNFAYRRDDAAPPVPQSLSVFSNVAGTAFTASAATSTGGSWLAVSPASGQAAGSVSVSVNPGTLAAGTYSGQVTINAPNASPSSVTAPVSLTVAEAPPALLSVSPPAVTSATVQGGAATQQQVVISNAGGGTLNFGVQVTGGSWLTAGATSGQAAPGSPALLPVTLNPQGLSAGTYRGSIVVRTSDGQQSSTVAVTLTVSPLTQSIVLTQTGLQFTAVSGGTAPPAQSFVVENGGLGTMNWTAVAQSVSGGSWLSVAPASRSAAAGVSTNTPVAVSVNPGVWRREPITDWCGWRRRGGQFAAAGERRAKSVLAPGDLPAPTINSVGLLPVGLAGGSPATDTTIFNLTNQPQAFHVGGEHAGWRDVAEREPCRGDGAGGGLDPIDGAGECERADGGREVRAGAAGVSGRDGADAERGFGAGSGGGEQRGGPGGGGGGGLHAEFTGALAAFAGGGVQRGGIAGGADAGEDRGQLRRGGDERGVGIDEL